MTEEAGASFSVRRGLRTRTDADLIRDDAPESVRVGMLTIVAYDLGLKPSWLRRPVCGALRVKENESNWSEYPNIWGEVQDLVYGCEWYRVYDIVETIYKALQHSTNQAVFGDRINALFVQEGIGWQLTDGVVMSRGDEAFEATVATARKTLDASRLPTAASELSEAIRDLSRRPTPDLSGAVHHATSSLECVARTITGDPKKTLGDILKGNPGLLPKPIDSAAEKLWGYASGQARHGLESRTLEWAEAQLIVGICAALSGYLLQRHGSGHSS